MKLKFLGTAAAEGVPAVFCNCPTCVRAKTLGGKDVRTRSQILIDDDTLFDFPMDTYMHMLSYKLDLSAIARVLISHSHMDHCYPQEFCMRGGPFASDLTSKTVDVYCNATVYEIFKNDTAREIRPEVQEGIRLNVLQPYDSVVSGDMRIVALPAVHTKGENCFVYYVERNGVGALLLNDTGILDIEVYKRLKAMGGHIDIATCDCTYGAKRHGPGRHMGLYDIVDQTELMKRAGLLNDSSVVYATHLSHNADITFAELERVAAESGIRAAYDGCEVEVRTKI